MPLTSCPDCGREVSTRARQCVHCGRPWPSCGTAAPLFIGIAIAVALLLGILAFGILRCKSKSDCSKPTDRSCIFKTEKPIDGPSGSVRADGVEKK